MLFASALLCVSLVYIGITILALQKYGIEGTDGKLVLLGVLMILTGAWALGELLGV